VAEVARFFTVSDDRFFLGTVALLNSMRLTGHAHELVVMDRGLTEKQKDVLAGKVTLVTVTEGEKGHAVSVKPFPGLLDVDGVVVILDSDLIVCDTLEPVLDLARSGKICVYPDPPGSANRWFAEWSELFALSAPLRHQRYVNSGFLALSVTRWPRFLERWWAACARIPAERVFRHPSDPLWAGDQEALNAILMSEVQPGSYVQLPEYADVWSTRINVADESTLRCTFRGERQPIVHMSHQPKVWQPNGWRRVRGNAYVRLMPRLLLWPDLTVRLDPVDVPFWLREGKLPRLTVHALGAVNRPRGFVARLPRAPRKALRMFRGRFERRVGREDGTPSR
jgi:hypothetical protein